MNNARQDFAPVGHVADVFSSALRVVQGEIALLRAEVRQRAQSAQTAIVMGVLAVVLGVTALNVLAGAAVAAVVAMGLPPHWAAPLVGVILAVIAGLLARKAFAALRNATGGTLRAVEQVRRDVDSIQSAIIQTGAMPNEK